MNALNILEIYKFKGFWVFDDESTGLEKEALVAGTDDIINAAVKDIPNADTGFMCLFSANPFPGYQIELKLKTRGDSVIGNWYHCPQFGIDGWLCGALYKYFEVEPETIYMQLTEKKS